MKLAVVVGTTRTNRQSIKEAKWIHNTAKQLNDVSAELIDLADYPLPFFSEPISPRFNQNREVSADVSKWLNEVNKYDAYVFVTPEYNHSIPGVLKNAIDYMTFELLHKPTAIASHGTVGGARAAMHLKEILSESKSVVIPSAVAVAGMSELIDEEGNLTEAAKTRPYGGPQAQLDNMLDELKWYSDALTEARNKEVK